MTDRAPDSGASESAVAAALAGRPGAWEELVGLWSRRVYAAAQSRLRDPEAAEEVTQAVMVTVYEHMTQGKYTHTGQFESWLFRIAMNRVRDVVRRTQRQRTRSMGEAAAGIVAAPAADGTGPMDDLRNAIARLPEADQEVISLRHHAQLGFAAIAEMLGEPLGTVLARHHRAIAKLRTQLEPHQQAAET